MNYLSLQYFVRVAEHLNFSQAAKALHISQPGLSQQISMLEKELGILLLKRSTRNVSLTEEGEFLYNQLLTSFQNIDNSVNELKNTGGEALSNVRIATVPSAASYIVPPLIRKLQTRHHNLDFFIKETTSVQVIKLILSGDYHLGFIRTPLDVENVIQPPLLWKEFEGNPLKVVVSSKHSLASASSVNLSEFAEETFLHFDPTFSPALHFLMENACLSAGFLPRTIGIGPEILTIANLIKQNIGIAILPDDMLKLIQDKDIIGLDLHAQSLASSVSMIWNQAPRRIVQEAVDSLNAGEVY